MADIASKTSIKCAFIGLTMLSKLTTQATQDSLKSHRQGTCPTETPLQKHQLKLTSKDLSPNGTQTYA